MKKTKEIFQLKISTGIYYLIYKNFISLPHMDSLIFEYADNDKDNEEVRQMLEESKKKEGYRRWSYSSFIYFLLCFVWQLQDLQQGDP